MTTPAERITAYLDARRRFPINTDQLAECKIGGQDWTRLTETDLRAVLADNERLTRELDDLADFDKADERRQRLQDERDRAVKLWHEQHKEVDRLTAQVAAKATPAQLLAAGAATAASYAEAVGRLRHELAEVKAKLAAAIRAAAASAELDAELTTAKRRLEVAYRREDDLRGAYEAAWAERNEARSLVHALYAAATDMAGRPWSMCALADVDPALNAEGLPDWLTAAEPPAVADGDVGAETGPKVGRDGAQEGPQCDGSTEVDGRSREGATGVLGPVLRLPEDWEAEYGITVRDPDGWRHDGKPWDEPIGLPEFQRRLGGSTVSPIVGDVWDRLVADVRAANEASEASRGWR